MISRRGLITGLATLLAAPAIVRASSIMPIKTWAPTESVDCYVDPLFTPGSDPHLNGRPCNGFATVKEAMDFIGDRSGSIYLSSGMHWVPSFDTLNLKKGQSLIGAVGAKIATTWGA